MTLKTITYQFLHHQHLGTRSHTQCLLNMSHQESAYSEGLHLPLYYRVANFLLHLSSLNQKQIETNIDLITLMSL